MHFYVFIQQFMHCVWNEMYVHTYMDTIEVAVLSFDGLLINVQKNTTFLTYSLW